MEVSGIPELGNLSEEALSSNLEFPSSAKLVDRIQ